MISSNAGSWSHLEPEYNNKVKVRFSVNSGFQVQARGHDSDKGRFREQEDSVQDEERDLHSQHRSGVQRPPLPLRVFPLCRKLSGSAARP